LLVKFSELGLTGFQVHPSFELLRRFRRYSITPAVFKVDVAEAEKDRG